MNPPLMDDDNTREVMSMAGRNSKPKNDGPAASPSRMDQFGDKLADSRDDKQARGNRKQ